MARRAAEREEQRQAVAEGQSPAGISGGGNSGNSGTGDGGAGSTGGQTSGGSIGSSGNNGGGSSGSGTGGTVSSGNTSAAQTIVNAAYGQLGVPYVYGGNGNNGGWDCSGLVQYCHSAAGISLPRTSQSQGGCGIAVSSPQPGDIVCYGTHVGI